MNRMSFLGESVAQTAGRLVSTSSTLELRRRRWHAQSHRDSWVPSRDVPNIDKPGWRTTTDRPLENYIHRRQTSLTLDPPLRIADYTLYIEFFPHARVERRRRKKTISTPIHRRRFRSGRFTWPTKVPATLICSIPMPAC